MSAAMEGSKPDVLNSWKEIASYLGRGVRTVQRWEAQLGMPVHRPHGHLRSAVVALTTEVDEWLRTTPQLRQNGSAHPANRGGLVPETIEQLRSLRNNCRTLVSSFRKTAQVHHQAVEKLMITIGNINTMRLNLPQGLPPKVEEIPIRDQSKVSNG